MASNSLASVCFSLHPRWRVAVSPLLFVIPVITFSPSASASFIAGIARALEHVPGQKLAKTAGQQATHSADQVAGAAAHAGSAPGPFPTPPVDLPAHMAPSIAQDVVFFNPTQIISRALQRKCTGSDGTEIIEDKCQQRVRLEYARCQREVPAVVAMREQQVENCLYTNSYTVKPYVKTVGRP